MAEFKRQTFQLSTGKQIRLHGNSFFINRNLEIGEGFVPNIFSQLEEQSDGKASPTVSNPYKSTLPISHRQFFESQRLNHIDSNNNCFVHAGFNPFLPFHEQPATIFYWDRILWQSAMNWQTKANQNSEIEPFGIVTPFHKKLEKTNYNTLYIVNFIYFSYFTQKSEL